MGEETEAWRNDSPCPEQGTPPNRHGNWPSLSGEHRENDRMLSARTCSCTDLSAGEGGPLPGVHTVRTLSPPSAACSPLLGPESGEFREWAPGLPPPSDHAPGPWDSGILYPPGPEPAFWA